MLQPESATAPLLSWLASWSGDVPADNMILGRRGGGGGFNNKKNWIYIPATYQKVCSSLIPTCPCHHRKRSSQPTASISERPFQNDKGRTLLLSCDLAYSCFIFNTKDIITQINPLLTSNWTSMPSAGLVRVLRMGRTCSQKWVTNLVEWTFFYKWKERTI